MFGDTDFNSHNGRVLTPFSFLKRDDRFKYGLSSKDLRVEGAPGFHGSGKIFSLGQPTLIGIENIIKFLGNKKIVWINLKEEPTIYINKTPYIVRDTDKPFSNISSFRSITAKNLEILENVLKEDVINESKTKRGFIHTFNEPKERELDKSITYIHDIMTNQEMWYHLKSKGYKVDYHRVPLPTEQFTSQCKSLNLLLDILEKNKAKDCIFLLTSSNDTKRSLFVLILIKLFYLTDTKKKDILEKVLTAASPISIAGSNIFEDNCLDKTLNEININSDLVESKLVDKNLEDIIKPYKTSWTGTDKEFFGILKMCLSGNFRIIKNLMFVIGEDTKYIVDYFIDKHSFPLNLRKIITINYLNAICLKNESHHNKALLCLERYITLLLFAEYMKIAKETLNTDFVSWLNNNPIFTNLLKYLDEQSHINKALFPLNLLGSEVRNELFYEMSKIGRFTMLLEFTNRTEVSYENNIHIMTSPNGSNTTGIWLNVREEPCVYINSKMYILKELINYHSNPTCFSGITQESLENFESKIKENLIKELDSEGRILLFRYTEEDIEEFHVDSLDDHGIETTREYLLRTLNDQTKYIRMPITPKIALKETIFDKIREICTGQEHTKFFIQSGGVGCRASYSAMIIDLCLNLSQETIKEKTFIKPIHALIRVLERGQESYEKVNFLYSKYFGEAFGLSNDGTLVDKEVEAQIKNMFLMVCFASFCLLKSQGTFLEFYNRRKDIQNLYLTIKNKEEIFLTVQNEYLDNYNVIKNRSGKVLGPMVILKNDFFIGSIILKQDKESNFPGNFRFVEENGILYAGCAMPTQPGIESALKAFAEALPNQKINTMWICLREEPVLYLDGSPYALRYVTKLCENIETTGISYGTLETVEEELCKDAKEELKDGHILLHDEIMKGGNVKDVGRYVKAKEVETTNSFFSKFNFEYHRVPVTDEKAPSPQIFDFFIKKLRSVNKINAFVLNCQMGRGRTTTALIIFYLIKNAHQFEEKKEPLYMNLPVYPPKYKLIGRLMQVLPNSPASKRILDSVVDKFAHVENIRDAIDRYSAGNFYVRKKGKDYLLRYFNLLIFTEFIIFRKEKSYTEFLCKHPEIQTISSEIEVLEMELI
ncbi:Paladin [Nosema granulosis]|uniref:Paladin n=1 Tax=Nosema granulosis TaxID=83296 RepID=A0A9P6GZ81_9MICR|nr:Paladin [Nosema granulosis]